MLKRQPGLLLICATLLLAGTVNAQQGTVIITDENCNYMLLDASVGQVLVKLIEGEMPRRGDTLSGEFGQRDFSDLTVQSDGSQIQAWIDLVDPNMTKALMRYRQYCP